MNKTKNVSLVVLALLLVGALGYIAYDFYVERSLEAEALAFDQGAQYGYTQAVATIAQNAATCQQVPLTIGNNSINLIAVACLSSE